jgi:dTDP-4-amino-4,6-dideoxygalactose transaminase
MLLVSASEAQHHSPPRLAIQGGEPRVRDQWPRWPTADAETERAVIETLRSGRWAVTGMSTGRWPREREFAEAFAGYLGVRHAVPVSSGSSALVVALEALGVGYGDEVLVPGLVWVACASAVTRVGATPILVDVEPDTLCMDPAAARAAATSRTRAILAVHLYSSLVDLDAFDALRSELGLPLVEDCSQAHGASWRGRRAGTFGDVAVFSFQDTKLLTCGEGGAVVTSDADLYDAAQQLRADGRRWASATVPGLGDLEEVGDWQGHNHCLGELQATVLLDRLRHLDAENARREAAVAALEHALEDVDGVEVLRRRDARVDRPTFFHLPLRIDRDELGGAALEDVRLALQAELGLFVEPLDAPLDANPLYNPLRSRRFSPEHRARLDPTRFRLPVARAAFASCVTLPHHMLLAEPEAMAVVGEAVVKVKAAFCGDRSHAVDAPVSIR